MTSYGYTLMTEQSGPRSLVANAVEAEAAGFDFAVSSDHMNPWLQSQGHSPNAWPVLGAVAQATERLELMTYVTCPTMRYHPVVVAQLASTVALLSEGRFSLGLGAGENLNEHVVGQGWPSVGVRHEMFAEALTIIKRLLAGETVDFAGQHFRVEAAKLWDVADPAPEIGVAVSGEKSLAIAREHADFLIAVEPDAELTGGVPATMKKVGQVPICWDPDRDTAIARAHDQFRWFAGGWRVNADLPTPQAFAAATQLITPEQVADSIPCGPDLQPHVDAIRAFEQAGFTHVAVVQIGGNHQASFLDWTERELLPALRSA
ncbi:MAG TPA: TIGR03557 family F420-dependent LLM class oxidoreductase [Mycobacteriales bacterium]